MKYPRGWFQVAWSDELAVGDVQPMRYFGQDLVLFRTESGQAVVLDAHCAHLGAHLGYGGTVEHECIVCPFHEWKWDSNGTNVATPHSERQTQRKRVRPWHTAETAGFVCVWYDPSRGVPEWDPPIIAEADDPFFLRPWPLATHIWRDRELVPQFVTENMVDVSHLKSVHLAARPAVLTSFGEDATRFRAALKLTVGEGKPPTRITPEGPVTTSLEAVADGMGFTIFKFIDLSPTLYVNSVTPVDEHTSDMRVSMFLPRDRGLDGDKLSDWGRASLAELVKQNERDFVIFSHLKYEPHPPFTPEEQRSYARLRRWSRQFYIDADAHAGVGGA
jgi:3-ketosteroid 9alpha-monooxygenase subunit A